MRQILVIIFSFFLGQSSFAQSDSVFLSIDSKLISEIQIITPNGVSGIRENYTFFKYRYWLGKIDTVSITIVDRIEPVKSKKKVIEYQKYGACDSIINVNAGGFSIIDLLSRINRKINDFPKQKEKLHLLVYSTLGVDIDKINQVKFDYELAKESLKFYKSAEIPKIEIYNIPKEVSNVSFVSNLVNSTNIVLNIDELIQPFTKDN